MLIDGRTVTTPPSSEVCVVGAGPAGLTLAEQLASKGISVLVVERGGLEPPSTTTRELSGELGDGLPYFQLDEARSMGLGGTSHLWPEADGLRSRPLDPVDFEVRQGVRYSGWPISWPDVASYYDEAERICRLAERSYELGQWTGPQTQPLDFDQTGFESAILKFGTEIDIFRRRRAQFEGSKRLSLLHHSTAARLKSNEADPARVESVRVITSSGREFDVTASVFVLAGGGIENARTLLLSRGPHAKGLGNHNDMVGRFFQEHLRIHSGVLVPASPSLVEDLKLYQRHVVDGYKTMGVLVPDAGSIRDHELLNSAIYLRPSDELRSSQIYRSIASLKFIGKSRWGKGDDPVVGHLSNLAKHPISAAQTVIRASRGKTEAPVIQLSLQTEQSPNPESRVTLGDKTDPMGLPVAKLTWRLNDLDLESARRIQELLGKAVKAKGIGSVESMLGTESPPLPVRGFWHHIGTTRMDTSPRSGVVDPNCRVHNINNVYVTGSSVFPTGGYANPTLTIVALALRLSRHLVGVLR